MWVFPFVGYVGVVFGFAFLTLAIASGLYYLSELVEEHTVLTKKLLVRLIYSIIAIQILLVVVDGFPVFLSLLSVISHAVYAGNLRHFPTVRLADPIFILSCVLVFANHYFWFDHFSTPPSFPSSSSGYLNAGGRYGYRNQDVPTFTEIASFFGVCIWLVPFALFVSLSAGENVLPSMGSEYATGDTHRGPTMSEGLGMANDQRSKKSKGLVKAAIDGTMDWIGESAQLMGFWRSDKRRF